MNILTQFRKPYLAMFAAFLIFFTSCNQYENNDAINENLETNKVSGKELFKGIFFFEGDIANQLSNFKNFEGLKEQLTTEEKAAFLEFQNKLISHIEVNYPGYFKTFEDAVSTKSHIIIRKELNNSRKIIQEAIQALTSLDYEDIDKIIADQKSNKVVKLDEIQNLKSQQFLNYQSKSDDPVVTGFVVWAVVALAAVAVSVAVVVDMVYWYEQPLEPVDELTPADLEQDIFVDSITDLDLYTTP